jgi:23S rRNA (cytosine1962-C5)-methyltransferase
MQTLIEGYRLLDSGDGRKLEQFGERIIDRPSSLCAWKRRENPSLWSTADARYDHEKGWSYSSQSSKIWQASIQDTALTLELLSNGQVGLFPEHAMYLPEVAQTIAKLHVGSNRTIRVLNLFAYSGLATSFCAQIPHVHVTHVDLSKRAIEWAKRNAELNSIADDSVRWIVDDALGFMSRESRKSQVYDIVIIDPPSFSRLSKKNSWTLDEKAAEIANLVLSVVDHSRFAIYFTNHSSASTSDVIRNISLDAIESHNLQFATRSLAITESSSTRRLPAGALIMLSMGLT